MGLDFSNLMGAASKLASSYGEEKSLKGFLSTIGNFGVTIKSRYEVNFSGIEDITYFVTNISVPGVKMNTMEINFAGKKVEIPINYEYEHDFTLTILNDNSGYIYTSIKEFLMTDTSQYIAPTGYTMTVKVLGDNNTKGQTLTLNGVRIKSVSALSFGNSDNDISTFDVECSCIDTNSTPGAMDGEATGIAGAIASLIS